MRTQENDASRELIKEAAKKSKGYGIKGVRFKLISMMLLVCAVPLVITLLISYIGSSNKAREDAEEMNVQMAELVEADFHATITKSQQAILVASESPIVYQYITAPSTNRNDEEMAAYLVHIDETLGDAGTNSTCITGADGMQIIRSKGDPVDVSEREYFKQAMAGNVYMSEVITSASTGTRIVTVSCPVYDADGETIVGIMQRNIDLSYLHELVVEEVNDGQDIFVTDDTGIVVAHSGHEITADSEPEDRSTSGFFTMAKSQEQGSYEAIGPDGKKQIISFSKEENSGWVIVVSRDYTKTMAAATRSAMISLIVGIVMLIIATAISLIMAGSFVGPILQIANSIQSLAEGRFIKIRGYANRQDEFGDIVRDVNAVIEKLGSIVSSIKNSAQSVDHSATELAGTADQISQTADDVSEAVQEIATGATQQADEVQFATENTAKISDNVQNVTESANQLEKTAGEMDTDSRDSSEQLRKLRVSSDEMGHAIDEITERIASTSRAVENINSKVEAINSIASQTNLLALNASIEAARAGEAGRGFAVVAEEIGKLADESGAAANEIHNEMTVLLEESQAAVQKANEVQKTTEEQKVILETTVESINKLIKGIELTVEGVRTITVDAEACTDSKTVVVDSMNSLSAISEENAASSEQTSASMQELNATVNTLATAADSLKDISNMLIEEMRFFQD